MFCDLHTHSIFSDGTCTPEELVDNAIKAGLSAVALTDHNTVDGLPDFVSAASEKNITCVAGAEFSADYNGKELHILGLFIPPEHFDKVSDLMLIGNIRKEESNLALIESLNQAGYNLNYEAIKSSTPNGKINRAHIAAAMLEKGYINSVTEAFDTVLSPVVGYYKVPERITAQEIIKFIDSIGAVSVLAHPFFVSRGKELLNENELVDFITSIQGLDGMECYYSTYDEAATEKAVKIADRFGLIKSGGSDFHGSLKPDIQLGIGKGNLKIPHKCYLELKERACSKRR